MKHAPKCKLCGESHGLSEPHAGLGRVTKNVTPSPVSPSRVTKNVTPGARVANYVSDLEAEIASLRSELNALRRVHDMCRPAPRSAAERKRDSRARQQS